LWLLVALADYAAIVGLFPRDNLVYAGSKRRLYFILTKNAI
jgi:hypothetical protein